MNTCQASLTACRAAPRPIHERLHRAMARPLEALRHWHERAQRRRELRDLPDYLLRDMGVAREDLYRQIDKPFRGD